MIQQNLFKTEEGFSYEDIVSYCKKHDVKAPAKDLYYYGEKCGWRTRKGNPFPNIAVFVSAYNGVWLERQRKIIEKEKSLKDSFYRALDKE